MRMKLYYSSLATPVLLCGLLTLMTTLVIHDSSCSSLVPAAHAWTPMEPPHRPRWPRPTQSSSSRPSATTAQSLTATKGLARQTRLLMSSSTDEKTKTSSKTTTKRTTKKHHDKGSSPDTHNKHDDDKPKPPKFPLRIIAGRVVDTVEDAFVHLKRVPYDLGWLSEDNDAFDTRPTILVLGSGWAAHALLKIADTQKLRLIVVSPTNHFVFTPMLASASVGTVEYRSMTEAIRAANPLLHQYMEGTATNVDLQRQTVTVELSSLLTSTTRIGAPDPVTIHYDKLVVAVGSKVNDALVPGAAEYCLRLKSCEDARKLRNAIGECLEYASRPDVTASSPTAIVLTEKEQRQRQQERQRRVTFCIVGGGPTGCELAGELSDFFRDTTRPRTGVFAKLRGDIKIVLIHGGGELVQQFDKDLRSHALKSLRKQGVDVRLNTYVEECGDGFIRLKDKYSGQRETLANGLTVWAAGFGPVPFVEKLLNQLPTEARGPNGRVFVDSWMRCLVPKTAEYGSVLVLGDAAAFEGGVDTKGFLPQTAQVAGQQGAFVARLLDRGYNLTATPPIVPSNDTTSTANWLRMRGIKEASGFDFLNLGLLAYVGGSEALSQIEIGDVPILSYAGSISFLLWRSVYLVKQVATRNRILVTFDWVKSAIFGRDVTRL